MAKIVQSKKGNKIVLRNPSETGKRYASQLRNGHVAETGEVLSSSDRAFRRGYLTARSDNAKAYNSKHGLKSKAKKRVSKKNRSKASRTLGGTYVPSRKAKY